ncbi:Cysteine proteinase inhibitor 6 [Hibiscus syriacus]|uniref:Cysteine proteinase inhibitor n=1 Tax=Hibiscus syriacus TaxID=106335 RepID=A0A6A2X9E4_HIBSY|nr:cysteine proteinase inhibitor 6-like [Hibiscus syriacus]XP_039036107.1 cysteine proteinase inhibitor 6-like [Hibiscus syriacus]KAE8671892.1 Cysteine proteinase inhibitor 6 [Hibiscus syriacus]
MQNPNFLIPLLFSIAIPILFLSNFSAESTFCSDSMATTTTLGGVRPSQESQNSAELENLARFAVDEHNKKGNAMVEFVRLVKASEQVVAGTLHHLTLEAMDAGKKKLYEAKVWVKPWMDFKELQEFKHAGDADDSRSFTASDLGANKGVPEPMLQAVATDDPVVRDAADHAVKSIQQRSNSMLPYELKEIVHANAEVLEDSAKLNMLLKLKRGDKEEKFKVEVHQKREGTYHLNHMEHDHS